MTAALDLGATIANDAMKDDRQDWPWQDCGQCSAHLVPPMLQLSGAYYSTSCLPWLLTARDDRPDAQSSQCIGSHLSQES